MFNAIWQDPRWTACGASLRKGRLYVKMPHGKAVSLVQALAEENQDLLKKEIEESDRAFVFYGSTDDWNEDLITLKALKSSITVTEIISAIEAGLRNEAQVDWISRVKGPAREESDTLGSLFGSMNTLELPNDIVS